MINKISPILITVFIYAFSVIGQENKTQYTPLANLDWQVSAKETFPLVPLKFEFLVSNNTELPTKSGWNEFTLALIVEHNGKKETFYQLSDNTNDYMNLNRQIGPKEKVTFTRAHDFNLRNMLGSPGDYKLTFIVQYKCPEGESARFYTNSFLVKIKDLPSTTDKKAYDFLIQKDSTSLFGWAFEMDDVVFELDKFSKDFENSIYADYAREAKKYYSAAYNRIKKQDSIVANEKRKSDVKLRKTKVDKKPDTTVQTNARVIEKIP
jgi:hypothetical protein